MTSLLERPITIKVNTNIQGTPINVNVNGNTERVTRIYQNWVVSNRSSNENISKHYYRVRTNKSQVYDIYNDLSTCIWYLDRIHY